MKPYLAGSVPKGDKAAADFVDWRKEYAVIIQEHFGDVELFDPSVFLKLEGDGKAVAGADCWYIQQSDVVIVNATSKLGAGTSMELVVAKYLKRPVVTVLPKDSHHRRSNVVFEGRTVDNWIHPFVETFSDVIVERPEDIPDALEQLKEVEVKDITTIDAAITYAKSRI